jgi:hypothetical protein
MRGDDDGANMWLGIVETRVAVFYVKKLAVSLPRSGTKAERNFIALRAPRPR